MNFRITPFLWPILLILSPVIVPILFIRNIRFKKNLKNAEILNKSRINAAKKIDFPKLKSLKLSIIVENHNQNGYLTSPGVSYLIETDQGKILFDLGFGDDTATFKNNSKKLNIDFKDIDGVLISHLHPDHMGGMKAYSKLEVRIPEIAGANKETLVYIPEESKNSNYNEYIVEKPEIIKGGLVSTGPLARSLFFMGFTEEQILVANVKNKGLILFIGCGHPKIGSIIEMVKKISDIPIYAIVGGLHLPVKDSQFKKMGIKMQMLFGTGKPPWQKISNEELDSTVKAINESKCEKILFSGHDSCDFAVDFLKKEFGSKFLLIKSGDVYNF